MRKTLLASIAVLCGVAPTAHAALLLESWKTPGDNLLVWDTSTNLEYLNWNETIGESYDTISSELSSTYAGFSYASTAQLNTLFTDAGISPFSPAPSGPLTSLVQMIGETDPGNIAGYSVPGYLGANAISGSLNPYAPGDYLIADLTVNTGSGAVPSYANATGGTISPDDTSPILGSALVREFSPSPVPEPASLALLAFSLFGLGLIRRPDILS